jgi:hypothetical protein
MARIQWLDDEVDGLRQDESRDNTVQASAQYRSNYSPLLTPELANMCVDVGRAVVSAGFGDRIDSARPNQLATTSVLGRSGDGGCRRHSTRAHHLDPFWPSSQQQTHIPFSRDNPRIPLHSAVQPSPVRPMLLETATDPATGID